ncbi:MAG: gfo/Idh/MocA family oxidoreductase [Calditrichaeota bacterium]|nr:MAG: gfo/Idh/MocA family oxidoreductase [Calditrichota bacterium]
MKVVVVGCGNMGSSHARAYHKLPGFELIGLVDSNKASSNSLATELGGIAEFTTIEEAFAQVNPDAVAVCTYPDTHYEITKKCLEKGVHVFVEKPLASTVDDAKKLVALAQKMRLKIVVGYILRVHPAWAKFTEIAQSLGKPLVMRMNLNQQSSGKEWQTHKKLMSSISPIVDCGVHYVDVMCQMTRSKPVRVQAIGARLSDEIDQEMYNYGQLQVAFADGSIGWYEAGWGPMMSQTAFFVKDVIGPKGCVSITEKQAEGAGDSSDIDSHTKTSALLLHKSTTDSNGQFTEKDELINTDDEPDHQELCNREQAYFLRAITENLDLTEHLDDAVNSLKIVLAADESVRKKSIINIQ